MHFYLLVAAFCHHNVSPHGFIYLYIFLHINLFGKGVCQQLGYSPKVSHFPITRYAAKIHKQNIIHYFIYILQITNFANNYENSQRVSVIIQAVSVFVSYLPYYNSIFRQTNTSFSQNRQYPTPFYFSVIYYHKKPRTFA